MAEITKKAFLIPFLIWMNIFANEVLAQKAFSFSAHYGPVAEFKSAQTEKVSEETFNSRRHSFLRLDLSAHRLLLRLGYASWNSSYELHYPNSSKLGESTNWEMKFKGVETGVGFALLLKEKMNWRLHAAYIFPLEVTEKENTTLKGVAKNTDYFNFEKNRHSYRFSNELEVKLNRYLSLTQELAFQYTPAFLVQQESTTNIYFFQALFGIKFIIMDKKAEKEGNPE